MVQELLITICWVVKSIGRKTEKIFHEKDLEHFKVMFTEKSYLIKNIGVI